MKTALITGINGFLGRHVARVLSKQYNVIGLSRSKDFFCNNEHPAIKVYKYHPSSTEVIFKENKIDIIVHTATVYGRLNEPTEDLLTTNVYLPIQLYECALNYHTSLFINIDTFFNKPNSVSYLEKYVLSKKHILDWLNLLKGNCKIANCIVYQQYGIGDSPQKFVPTVLNALQNNVRSIDLTLGAQTRDFIYVEDVANGLLTIINSASALAGCSEFHLGTGKSTSIQEFVEYAKFLTKSKTYFNFGKIPYRENEIMESVANNQSLIDLGWIPKYSLKEGLLKLIENKL